MQGIRQGMDLYWGFGLPIHSTEEEITDAFRKQAILCHPDKYPGNKKKTEIFQTLCRAFAILTDSEARAAYDKVLKRKAINSIIVLEQDGKKPLEDPQQNERFREQKADEERVEYEIARIVESGSAKLDRELENFKKDEEKIITDEEVKEESNEGNNELDSPNRVKINWHSRAKSHVARYETCVFTGYKKKKFQEMSPSGEIRSLVVLPFSRGAVVEIITKKPGMAETKKQREYRRARLADKYKSVTWDDGKPVSIKVSNLNELPNVVTKEEQQMDAYALQAILHAAEKKRLHDELVDILVAKYRAQKRLL